MRRIGGARVSGVAVVIAAFLVALAVAACEPPDATPTPSPGATTTRTVLPISTSTNTPTPTPPLQTPTPTPPPAGTPSPTTTGTITPTATLGPASSPTRPPIIIPTATPPGPTPAPTATGTPTPTPTATSTPTPLPTFTTNEGAINAVGDSIVRVRSELGVGSGVIFERFGDTAAHVLTNQHLVGRAMGTITVTAANGSEYSGSVIGRDSLLDIAVVRICCSLDFETLPFAGVNPAPRSQVYIVGYPMGSTALTATERTINFVVGGGPVSATRLELNGAMNAGTSGGPMIDRMGRLVALTNYRARPATTEIGVQDAGFGIAVESIVDRLDDLIAGEIHYVPTPTPCPDVTCGVYHSEIFGYEIDKPQHWLINTGSVTNVRLWNPYFGNTVFVDVRGVSTAFPTVDDLMTALHFDTRPGWENLVVESDLDIFRAYAASTQLTEGHEFVFRFDFQGIRWAGRAHWLLSKTAGSNNLYQVYAVAPAVIFDRAEFEAVEREMLQVQISFGPPKPF